MYKVSCRYMALSGPLTVLSVEYRLSPAHLYPVPINDGWDAFQYIVTNLSSLLANLAPGMTNLVVSGTSSGGQIAAIVSRRAQTWMKGNVSCDNITMSGVLLRAPVTVRATEARFIPPAFRDLHKSWCAELETVRLTRREMEEMHCMYFTSYSSLAISLAFATANLPKPCSRRYTWSPA